MLIAAPTDVGSERPFDLDLTQQNDGPSNETNGHRDQQQPDEPLEFPYADGQKDETEEAYEVA